MGRIPLDRLEAFDRILLLQGPVGPFFDRLALYLLGHGKRVHKIHFNAGDAVFFGACPADSYRGPANDFGPWLADYLRQRKIEVIALFGEWRLYHRTAHEVASGLRIPVFVFEEGYIRPHYLTLEGHGVNGNTLLPRDPTFYRSLSKLPQPRPRPVRNNYWRMAWFTTLYYIAGVLGRWRYPHYQHHRPLQWYPEGLYWVRSGIRKLYFRLRERGLGQRLQHSELHKKFFLVPLQVHIDSQVTHHSCFRSVTAFLRHVVSSFAAHAPADRYLVVKHHPMDRGYTDYSKLLTGLAAELQLGERLIYVHDLHLPTLLENSCGVVTINSTVGLSALIHNTPVKTLGESVYDVPGVVSTLSLPDFWADPGVVDVELFLRFKRYMIQQTQLNCSFYAPKALDISTQIGSAETTGTAHSFTR